MEQLTDSFETPLPITMHKHQWVLVCIALRTLRNLTQKREKLDAIKEASDILELEVMNALTDADFAECMAQMEVEVLFNRHPAPVWHNHYPPNEA